MTEIRSLNSLRPLVYPEFVPYLVALAALAKMFPVHGHEKTYETILDNCANYCRFDFRYNAESQTPYIMIDDELRVILHTLRKSKRNTKMNDLSFCPTPKALANFVVAVYAMKQVLPDMNDPAIKQILSHIGIVIGGGCVYDEATNELLCVADGNAHRISLAPSAVEALRVHKSN